MHAPGEPGDLPYAVGCPAFTRELRQVQWPSTKNFKPDVPEKYDGKLHPSEFLSIYTIAVQAAGAGRQDPCQLLTAGAQAQRQVLAHALARQLHIFLGRPMPSVCRRLYRRPQTSWPGE